MDLRVEGFGMVTNGLSKKQGLMVNFKMLIYGEKENVFCFSYHQLSTCGNESFVQLRHNLVSVSFVTFVLQNFELLSVAKF